MLKKFLKPSFFLLIALLSFSNIKSANAKTQEDQFVLGGGVGAFLGSNNLGGAFAFDLEPEYFLTDHISASFRFDVTAGKTDSAHLGARARYYFGIAEHEAWNIYVGAGAGFIINFNGANYGDLALPVLGYQYDLTDRFKIGSDVSLDIVFNGNKTAVATRLMPLQLKLAF